MSKKWSTLPTSIPTHGLLACQDTCDSSVVKGKGGGTKGREGRNGKKKKERKEEVEKKERLERYEGGRKVRGMEGEKNNGGGKRMEEISRTKEAGAGERRKSRRKKEVEGKESGEESALFSSLQLWLLIKSLWSREKKKNPLFSYSRLCPIVSLTCLSRSQSVSTYP